MNKSELFKIAHKITKKIIRRGDDYRITFGACLKFAKEQIENKVLSFKFKTAFGFEVKKTKKSGKSAFKVEVGSLVWEMLKAVGISETLCLKTSLEKTIQITGYGEEFQEADDYIMKTDRHFQYIYFEKVK